MNIAWPKRKIIPPRGVYLCRAYMDGYGYNGIANVGVRPTVSNEEKVWLETFLLIMMQMLTAKKSWWN